MAPRLILVTGRKNAGKTTLAVALIRALRSEGRRVMSLKHGHHPAVVDRAGTDTWRHFHEGEAERTLIAGPSTRVLFERTPDDYNPEALVRRYMYEADIVVAEGFSNAPIPRVEVVRREAGPPVYSQSHPLRDLWVAIVADETLAAHCPTYRFDDTNWLTALTSIVMERAAVVRP